MLTTCKRGRDIVRFAPCQIYCLQKIGDGKRAFSTSGHPEDGGLFLIILPTHIEILVQSTNNVSKDGFILSKIQ